MSINFFFYIHFTQPEPLTVKVLIKPIKILFTYPYVRKPLYIFSYKETAQLWRSSRHYRTFARYILILI